MQECGFLKHKHILLNTLWELLIGCTYEGQHAHVTSTYVGKDLHAKGSKWADERTYNITTATLCELKWKHDSPIYQHHSESANLQETFETSISQHLYTHIWTYIHNRFQDVLEDASFYDFIVRLLFWCHASAGRNTVTCQLYLRVTAHQMLCRGKALLHWPLWVAHPLILGGRVQM